MGWRCARVMGLCMGGRRYFIITERDERGIRKTDLNMRKDQRNNNSYSKANRLLKLFFVMCFIVDIKLMGQSVYYFDQFIICFCVRGGILSAVLFSVYLDCYVYPSPFQHASPWRPGCLFTPKMHQISPDLPARTLHTDS